MLAVTVEVWPGGDIRRRRVIHTVNLVNETELSDISDYSLYIDGFKHNRLIEDHRRNDGALLLLREALTAHINYENGRPL